MASSGQPSRLPTSRIPAPQNRRAPLRESQTAQAAANRLKRRSISRLAPKSVVVPPLKKPCPVEPSGVSSTPLSSLHPPRETTSWATPTPNHAEVMNLQLEVQRKEMDLQRKDFEIEKKTLEAQRWKEELENTRELLKMARNELGEKELQLSEKVIAVNDADMRERRVRNEVEVLKSHLASKEDECNSQKILASTLQGQLSTLQTQLATKEAELIGERTKISALQGELRSAHEATKCLEEENLKVETQRMEQSYRDELREKDRLFRQLHNDVVDLKGRIRVSVRVRPLLSSEAGSSMDHLSFPNMTTLLLQQSCLHGYNVSIIAYGQTGSGKTHTMRGGSDEDEGLIPRTVKFLFETRSALSEIDWMFSFSASFLEVYNDEIFDLLAEKRRKLELKVSSGVVVEELSFHPIDNINSIDTLLARADANRRTASTRCNETSSRSHAVFTLHVRATNAVSNSECSAVLNLVDLAGSERAKESGAEGDRFVEMTHINSALSALQNVIRAQLKKQSHVPYRDNKLTLLLQESLGAGNSKTMVIVNLNPSTMSLAETKRSLEFASQMSLTKIGAAKKHEL